MTKALPPDSRLKVLGISITLSCLYFIRVYRQLLYPAYDWYFEYEVPRLEILTTLFCSLVLFCVFFGLLLLIRDQQEGPGKRNLQLLFIALAVLGFGPLSGEFLDWWFLDYEAWFKYPLPVLVLVICLLLSARGKARVSRLARNIGTATIFALPFVLILFGQALLVGTGVLTKGVEPNSIETTVERAESEKRLPRVVWIIFDELDFTALSQRPSNIHLPAFDELASSSFVAENAFPPNVSTSVSTPTLLTGKKVYWVEPHGPDKMTLHFFGDEPAVELTETDTVFDDVAALNGKAAVAGWNHPYPRLFPDTLSIGHWAPRSVYRCREFGECVLSAFGNSFEDMPLLRDLFKENFLVNTSQIKFIRKPLLTTREHLEATLFLRNHAERLVTNESIDLVFLHLIGPHAPFLKRQNEPAANYFEALESTDETISELRDAMKGADLWDRTTVIVSSDHWFRSNLDWSTGQNVQQTFEFDNTRVPFIVKPAGGGQGLRYSRRFNTVITRYLIQSIMTGELSTTEDIAGWLDKAARERPELVNFHSCLEGENPVSLDRYTPSGTPLTCK